LCLTSTFIAAQTSYNSNLNEWKLYGGYQYVALDSHSVQDALNLEHVIDPAFPLLNFGDHQHLNGWNFGIQNDITKWFGVVVDVGGSYGETRLLVDSGGGVNLSTRTKMSFFTFTGGPQFTLYRGTHFQPFVRALVGGGFFRSRTDVVANNVPVVTAVSADDEGFAGGGGAGSDFFFSPRFGLRIKGDWLRTPFFGEAQNNIRGTGGLVFRF
jgi:hypothetical protein